jgi:nucleoid-associated protein YgaU
LQIDFPCLACGAPVRLDVPDQMGPGFARRGGVSCPACGTTHGVEIARPADGPPVFRQATVQPRAEAAAASGEQQSQVATAKSLIGGMLAQVASQMRAGQHGHDPIRRVLALKLSEHLLLEVRPTSEGGVLEVRVVDESEDGYASDWEPSCSGCLGKIGSALQRAHWRARSGVQEAQRLAGVPLRAVHEVEVGDTLATIAAQHYGLAELAGEVFEANRDVFLPGEPPLPGDILRIPARPAAADPQNPGDGT